MKKINLQLFAEAAGEGTAAGTAQGTAEGTGEATLDAAGDGRSQEADSSEQDDTADERTPFEELIKGDYKKDFEDKVHKIIGKRSAEIKSARERIDSMSPIMDLLASKYGVDASDIASLEKAIIADNHHLEEEAVERGMTVEQLRNLKQIEHENKILRDTIERNKQQTESDRIYNEWMEQAEGLKEIYPDFDFVVEAANDSFARLLRNGVDVRTAYEVIHKDEIIQGAMAVTAQKVKESVSNDIRANGNRAAENGTKGQSSAAFTVNDIKNMTRAQRQELAKRAARGEKIKL